MRTINKVLVTGAGGFIGSHLTRHLLETQIAVRAFVRYKSDGGLGFLADLVDYPNLEIIRGDLRDYDACLESARHCDTIFHLASHISIPYSKSCPRDVFDTNTGMALNLLGAAEKSCVERVVMVSSSEVYGSAQTIPIKETHPLHPQSVYSASKVATDQLSLAWFRQRESNEVVVIRPFNTYGPHQSLRAVIPTVICQALCGNSINLGNLSSTRDFLYVSDTVRAMVCCGVTDSIAGETIQVGTGVETSIGTLVELVGELLHKKLEVHVSPERLRGQTEEVTRLVADISKAKKDLNWEPTVSLNEGLEKTIQWLKSADIRTRSQQYLI